MRRAKSVAGSTAPVIERTFGIEKDHDIDIARIIEFARAKLAKRQNHETAAGFDILAIGKPQPARAAGLPQHMTQRRRDEGIGGA